MNVKKYLMIVCCVLGVCLAALSGVILASKALAPLSEGGGGDVLQNLPKPSKSRSNILIMGTDNSGLHTDTLMLVSIDNVYNRVNILSIPRDTRVVFQGQYDKINHLFSYKGREENTINAVTQVTGVPIHYYAVVDFKGFRNIIDLLGGVEFDVPNVAGTGGMYYNDPAQNLKISIKAGLQTLSGADAEGLVRYRDKYPQADEQRIRVQQQFVKALIQQKLQMKYITKALDIYKEVVENTRTNFTAADAASHIMTLRALKGDAITTMSLPGQSMEASTRYGYLSCFIPNPTQVEEAMEGNFRGTPQPPQEIEQPQE